MTFGEEYTLSLMSLRNVLHGPVDMKIPSCVQATFQASNDQGIGIYRLVIAITTISGIGAGKANTPNPAGHDDWACQVTYYLMQAPNYLYKFPLDAYSCCYQYEQSCMTDIRAQKISSGEASACSVTKRHCKDKQHSKEGQYMAYFTALSLSFCNHFAPEIVKDMLQH